MNLFERGLNTIINFAFQLWPEPKPKAESLQRARLVAHRGVHENNLARENSMFAFELAHEHQIWAIELDVRFTHDGVPVVHHDADADRLFGRPDIRIADVTLEQLRSAVPEIPTLEEVISKFGKKLHLMIEIKESHLRSPQNRQNLVRLLNPLQPGDDYHLLSLEPQELEPIAADIPKNVFMDVIWIDAASTIRYNNDLGHGAIAGHFLFFNTKRRETLRQQGKQIGTGFIQTRKILYRELNKGVDFIFTNHPLTLKRYLQE